MASNQLTFHNATGATMTVRFESFDGKIWDGTAMTSVSTAVPASISATEPSPANSPGVYLVTIPALPFDAASPAYKAVAYVGGVAVSAQTFQWDGAEVADSVWATLTSALTVTGSIGKWLLDHITAVENKTTAIVVTEPASVVSSILTGGRGEIRMGDSYLAADGTQIKFSVSGVPDLASSTVTWTFKDLTGKQLIQKAGSFSSAGQPVQNVECDLTTAESALMPVGTKAVKAFARVMWTGNREKTLDVVFDVFEDETY